MELSQRPAFRPADAAQLKRMFIAGLVALFAWEIFSRLLTPLVIGGPLEPAALILSLFRLPGDYRPAAELLHYVTGLVFYPAGFAIITRYMVSGGAVVDGVVYGALTFIFALAICAPLAGLPLFLGFIPLTWMSLTGHLIYGLLLAGIDEARHE